MWETVVQQEIPAEVLARVSAYDWLVSLAAMPLGYVLGPVLGRELGYAWPLTGAAVLVLISATIPVTRRDVRELRLRHAPAEHPGRLQHAPAALVVSARRSGRAIARPLKSAHGFRRRSTSRRRSG